MAALDEQTAYGCDPSRVEIIERATVMTDLRYRFWRWQSARYERQRFHREQAVARSRDVLAGYGLDFYPHVGRTNLSESLVVAALAASRDESLELS